MSRDYGGHKRRLTKQERETILQLFVEGRRAEAQAIAASLGLAPNYAWKLARARGAIPLIPRTGTAVEFRPKIDTILRSAVTT